MMYISDMSTTFHLRERIANIPAGEPFCTTELLGLARRGAIDQALARMVKRGELCRVARGAYVRPLDDNSSEATDRLIEKTVVAICAVNGVAVQVDGKEALRRLGLETDNGGQRDVYLSASSRRSRRICGRMVEVKRVSPRKIALSDRPAGLAIAALWQLGKEQATLKKVREIVGAIPLEDQNILRNSRAVLPGWADNALLEVDATPNEPEGESSISQTQVIEPKSESIGAVTDERNQKPVSLDQSEKKRWTSGTVEGRWSGFGPYYAMFPVEFARSVVDQYCPSAGTSLDPFCGRGTVPFVAMATGRHAAGCDINPVAWLYAKVKTAPHPDKTEVIRRAQEIGEAVVPGDLVPENEFQKWAWAPNVLGYLNAARRLLDWRASSIDRTLMGTLLVHLHAKLGNGLSNQIRQSKSMSPGYSVAWWKKRNMLPPDIDVVPYLKARLDWRYGKGIVAPADESPTILLQDARMAISKLPDDFAADLVLTSPPYCGVTNYRYDNWIRLWLLNEGPALPGGEAKQRYANKEDYKSLLTDTFAACATKTKEEAIIYVRTDARSFTLETTISALRNAWPEKEMFFTHNGFKKATQTALYGDTSAKPGEVDLLLLPAGIPCPDGFARQPRDTGPKL